VDEERLVEAAKAGDRDAASELLASCYPKVYALSARMLRPGPDAEDATQQAMLAVIRALPGFDARSRFSTWVHRIAVNVCLDELRRRARHAVVGLPGRVAGDGNGDDSTREGGGSGTWLRRSAAEARAERDEVADAVAGKLDLEAALQRLSPGFRAAVVLRDVSGLSYEEIAEVLGIPLGTVRSRIARGRGILADMLRDALAPESAAASSGNDRGLADVQAGMGQASTIRPRPVDEGRRGEPT